jgi:hypothetical protein
MNRARRNGQCEGRDPASMIGSLAFGSRRGPTAEEVRGNGSRDARRDVWKPMRCLNEGRDGLRMKGSENRGTIRAVSSKGECRKGRSGHYKVVRIKVEVEDLTHRSGDERLARIWGNRNGRASLQQKNSPHRLQSRPPLTLIGSEFAIECCH